ncbi:uncharacterized protein TRIADDRAFT_62236 [Trichoplax adhaerens]|uniref:G-protein coupled receptors family 1 profile domain-containing protein n=1 Tax=Trichoplax adhaerens TaxID=10228 RepID=B3SD79_TRIAD|nr:hypothetical protein TRIADDRAFT_62236 [Trichoplax adhaerens]EDV19332.1 hypothetical protein TRIADDRAFT_62236 [Trichoplax adhaerens]|eukprot:XP_002118183.1 hypothetical protein TRIADDRAFT_62236 [Trichoplax adhaerens]
MASQRNGGNLKCSDRNCPNECIYFDIIEKNPIISLNKTVEGQDLVSGIYIGIGIIGIIFNALVLVTLKKKQVSKSKIFRSLMMNLAIADLFSAAAVSLLGIKTIAIILSTKNINLINVPYLSALFNYSLELSKGTNAVCQVSYIFFFITNFVSTLTLTCMGIERYRALIVNQMCKVSDERSETWKIRGLLASIWIVSTVGSIPFAWMVEVTPRVYNRCFFAHHHPCGYCHYNLIVTILTTCIFGLIPAVIMLYCYIHLARFLLKYGKERRASFSHQDSAIIKRSAPNSPAAQKLREKQAAFLSIIVAFLFLLTMTPFIAYLLFISISHCNGDEILHVLNVMKSNLWIGIEAAHMFFVLPPLLNPICYSFCNRSFRLALMSLCKKMTLENSQSSTKISLLSSVRSHLGSRRSQTEL